MTGTGSFFSMFIVILTLFLGSWFIFLEIKRDKHFFSYDKFIIPILWFYSFFPAFESSMFFSKYETFESQKINHFENNLEKIKSIKIFDDGIIYKFTKKENSSKEKEKTYFAKANIDLIKNDLSSLKIEKEFENSSISKSSASKITIFYLGFLLYVVFYFKKENDSITPHVDIDNVIGLESQKRKAHEIIDIFKGTSLSRSIGYLFEGPPGLGKTLLAQAIATESDAFFQNINSSSLESMYVGSGSQQLKIIFKKAIANAPSIIFFDEFDSIGAKRESGTANSKYYNQSTSTFLQCMNDIELFNQNSPHKVIVIAATNHMKNLDSAAIRSGRFDEKIKFTYPTINDRIALLHHFLEDDAKEVDVSLISKKIVGFSPADIKNLINKARARSPIITTKNLTQYILDISVGEKLSLNISEKDLYRTAVHESGHALISYMEEHLANPSFVSIQPRGLALGITANIDDSEFDKVSHSKKECEADIRMLLAGQLAEKILLEDISSGASNDIERATEIAKQMVFSFGMSDLGMIKLDNDLDTKKEASKAVISILKNQQEKTQTCLERNKLLLGKLSDILLKEKELSKSELENILSDALVNEETELS